MTDSTGLPIAFVGLGKTGAPMAHNLQRAGFPLAGYDVNPAAAGRLQVRGPLKLKQIIAASMRKLLHLCFGALIKSGRRFDPNYPGAHCFAALG